MKPIHKKLFVITMLSAAVSGCSNREAELQRAKEEAENKARAEAAKNEMKTLPETFKTRDVFKKNETPTPQPIEPAEPKKTP